MKMNRSGNTLVMVLVVSTLILGGVVISMQYVGLTNTSSINALKNSSAGADDLIALDILSGKLTMTKDGSEWGVEPYPIGSELALSTFKPYIKNFSTLAQGTKSYVPNLRAEGQKTPSGDCRTLAAPTDRLNSVFLNEECRRTNFDLDASLLGSLERGGDIGGWSEALSTRNQTELQKGFVGYPKPSQLIEGDFKNFLNGTTATFPPDGIKAKAVTFYKLGFDKNEPRILSSLEVSVGDTRAIIPFPAPPDPKCKITTQIESIYKDCRNEQEIYYTHEIVGYHNESRSTSSTKTVATSTPVTSVTICRCSNTSALFLPLYPRVNNCDSTYPINNGCVPYSSGQTIYHVNLGPRPGYFMDRGMIYCTDPNGEQLGKDEIDGKRQITFADLLREMGVNPNIAGTKEETTSIESTVSVADWADVRRERTIEVCDTKTPLCDANCIKFPGTKGARTQLFADSIVGSFKVSADSFKTFFPSSAVVPDSSRQSIQTIREFSPTFPTEVPIRMPVYEKVFVPPADLYTEQGFRIWPNDDEHGTWTVGGQVAGLQKDPKTATCEKDVQVYPPPPPHCVASVANARILKGESTVVTLDCNQSGSGRVIEARIMNGNSFPVDNFAPSRRGASDYKVARASYTRTTDYQIETINIAVTGLGGSINVSTLLGAVCPHNDPNYVSYIQKEVFAQAPLRRTAGVIGEWWVGEASNVWNPTNAGYEPRWDPRVDTADSVNHFNMGSFQLQSTPFDRDPNSHRVIGNLWIKRGGVYYWVAYGPKRDPNCGITQYALRRAGCFTSDTRIRMADGREKLVSKISENDLIWNPLYQSPVKVIKVVKGPEKKALYQLRVAKNRLVVTEDHPFLTQRGWVRADELSNKDLIMGEGLGKQILSVKKLSYKKPVDVFNFELDTDIAEGHMVIANGIPTGDLTTQLAIKQNRKNLP